MKNSVIIFLILITPIPNFAQSCLQKLQDAQRAYLNGQFSEVEQHLSGCLQAELEKADRLEAYKLMVNSKLLLNEEQDAENYMQELLVLDPAFNPSEIDLVEFRNLFETYEIVSRYSVGPVLGAMRPDYRIIKHQSIAGRTEEPLDYDENPGFYVGLTGDVRLIYDFYISGSVFFEQRGFEQSEVILDIQRIKSTEREYRINVPLQIKYIYPVRNFRPFLSAGYSYHYLLRAEADLERFALEPEVTGTPIGVPFSADNYDITDLRRRSTFNWLVGMGVQMPLRAGYLLEFRANYERGLQNLIEEENRFTDQTLVDDFAYVPDDVMVSSWMFGLTLMRHFTKPRKK